MAEIGFYHLTRTDELAALPALLTRTLAVGEKALVLCGSEARVAAVDTALWLADWLPHGTAKTPHPQWQPVFISARPENPADAKFLFLLDGVDTDVNGFARVFDLFDGNNETAVAAARTRWKTAKDAGHAMTYWKQSETGWAKAG
ncbi:MAG: DNA polymerase III subunit chi [Acidocella sp. 20-57-95]|nr:MAG: DNA polymerase III subunit chi [Acidocella sp. 20-57-95]OYV62475.1 MAG: DNA polymerase III subunit chi [Acidocella sp. 21-58-7]HQT64110.1 DNA polymerase III subunit chi [Acidocella sp.]HQU03673.1 DNA polymerase III subunit chi [Acidocella sp.]